MNKLARIATFLLLGLFVVSAGAQRTFPNEPSMPKRLGETITLPFVGDVYTAIDGTVWKAQTAIPLAYSATYASLLTDTNMVTAAVTMNGPFTSNTWQGLGVSGIAGATAGGSTWVMFPNTAFAGDKYFTSTNAGSTWTARTPPVASKTWATNWNGTQFLAYAANTGATGAQTSTDGITWTSHTGISLTLIQDLIWNGSTYLAVSGNGQTAAATSPDGITWTSRTMSTTNSPGFNGSTSNGGIGGTSWNAGAGLFITGTNSAGTYQTSPDGATWTNRTLPTDRAFGTPNSLRFASNATITVLSGIQGIVAYSTDCINWTIVQIDPTLQMPTTSFPSALIWDGTRFVWITTGVTYYSTTGATWTKATRGVFPMGSLALSTSPTGILATAQNYAYHLTDFTSSATNNIVPNSQLASIIGTMTYQRIK